MDFAKSFPPDKEAPRAADKPVKPPDRKPAKIHLPSAVTTKKHPRRPLAAMLYELIAVVSVPLGFVFFGMWFVLMRCRSVRAVFTRSESAFPFL